jgi:hypothetical protein
MSTTNDTPKATVRPELRWLYIGFVAFGIYQIAKQHYGDAAMYLGIALAFDPFDTSVSWKQRKLWQRAVLIIHLAVVAGCFGYEIGTNDDIKNGVHDGWNGK